MPLTITAEREADLRNACEINHGGFGWCSEVFAELDAERAASQASEEQAEKRIEGILAEFKQERAAHQETQAIARELLEALEAGAPQIQPCASKYCYEHGHEDCAFGLQRAARAKAKGVLPAEAK
jgi:hypothetical protein